jgi:hypothetical protein
MITPYIDSDPAWNSAFTKFKLAFDFYVCTGPLYLPDTRKQSVWDLARRPARELFETALINAKVQGELSVMY